MVKPIHPVALFRYGILGPLVSRQGLEPGELKVMLGTLSEKIYQAPNGKAERYSSKTIERWYYAYLKGGYEALNPKPREDRGHCQLPDDVQQALLAAKLAKPARSINTLIQLLQEQRIVSPSQLSRSSVHRLLKCHGLSKRTIADAVTIERRSFEAKHAGDIWYGDVMHGIPISTPQGMRKTYLVSVMDDASRLICHSAFYLDESSVSIEHALKEALLKRGLPKKFVVDNGAAYRANSLQEICMRLKIHCVYCRPYEPEGKGKLERWHRVVRETFLTELNRKTASTLDELNDRLFAWIEEGYHQTPHSALKQKTPLQRYREDLAMTQPLGSIAPELDHYFYHRIKRTIRKDGTLSFKGNYYEVPYQLADYEIYLVFEPASCEPKWIESLEYQRIGDVVLLDKQANLQRNRQRPTLENKVNQSQESINLVDEIYHNRQKKFDINQVRVAFSDQEEF